jgi:PAS domain-containing protein
MEEEILLERIRELTFKLALTEARIELIISHLPGTLWSVTPDLKFSYSVGAGLLELGLKPNEVVGKSLQEFFGEGNNKAIEAHLRVLETGEPQSYEFDYLGLTFLTHLAPLIIEGQVIRVIGLAIMKSRSWT